MNRCLFLLWLLLAAFSTEAQQQQCFPANQLWRYGTSMEKLNTHYPSLLEKMENLGEDSLRIQQFNFAANAWFSQLATYLKDNGVKLSEKDPMLFRIYVNKNNQVQYLLYHKTTKWKKGGRMQSQLHQHAEAFMRLNPANFGYTGPWRHSIRLKVE